MKQLIRKILKEETFKDEVKKMIADDGVAKTATLFGGIENLVNTVYDGDLKTFFKESGVEPYKIADYTESFYIMPNMYISEYLVKKLGIKTINLGEFKWGPKKDNLPYTAFCELKTPCQKHKNGLYYCRVIGHGHTHRLGYNTNKNPIPKTYRKKIFQQIIDKYNLDSYK